MTLSQARRNTLYKIVGVSGTDNARRRLLDMGFTPDCNIYVHSVAPGGGTVLVVLRGFMVALRPEATEIIEIRK